MGWQFHFRWHVFSFFVALFVFWSAGGPAQAYSQSRSEEGGEASPHLAQAHSPSEGAEAHAAEEEHGESTSTWDRVFQWVNFLVVIGALVYLMKKYVAPLLQQRAKAIREEMERSAQALEEASHRLGQIEEKLQRLDTEIVGLRRSALDEAAAEQARIEQQTQLEANKIVKAAEQEIQGTTKMARQELKAYTAELAIELAQQRIRQAISPEMD
ncbi:MAG: ATP synthase F0 subunit B [Acidobacteria bacterium]|nr:ATP synthase F0 subunit B [Acidobacteriota bacterium]